MKRFILSLVAAVMLSSCAGPVPVTRVSIVDSTSRVLVEANLDLPSESPLRDTLSDILYNQLSTIGVYENGPSFPKEAGDGALVYIRKLKEFLDGEHLKQSEEMASYADGEVSEMQRWEVSVTLDKIADTVHYAVFSSQFYANLGGAHGGIGGAGTVIVDKRTGTVLRGVIDRSAVTALQPVLRKGLLDYINENSYDTPITDSELDDCLLLFGGPVPLPAWEPVPDKDGLIFTYQQYEITPYSLGMPSFTVPYSVIAPYMTPPARELFGTN